MSRILVTGGSGLLGWPATRQLVAAGHDPVVYDLRPSADNLRLIGTEVPVVQGDVLDFENLLRVVKTHRIDRILHLAAVITDSSARRPIAAIRGNALGTSYIFEIAHALDLERVVWASTVSVNGTPPDYDGTPVPEGVGYSPDHPYGVSKLACEIMARTFRDDLGLDIVAVRPPVAYGIGRFSGAAGAFNAAIRDLVTTGSAEIPCFDPIRSQLIYNRDMAAFFVEALLSPTRFGHDVYNTPVLRDYSGAEILEVARGVAPDARITLGRVPAPAPPVMDASRARAEFSFVPKFPLSEALIEMAEHYRAEEARTGEPSGLGH